MFGIDSRVSVAAVPGNSQRGVPASQGVFNAGVVPKVLDTRMAKALVSAAKWTTGAAALDIASIGLWKYAVMPAIAAQSLPAIGTGTLVGAGLAGGALIAGGLNMMNSRSSGGPGAGFGTGMVAMGIGALGALFALIGLAPISFPVLGAMTSWRALKEDAKLASHLIHRPDPQAYAELSTREQIEIVEGLPQKLSNAKGPEREDIFNFITMVAAQGCSNSRYHLEDYILPHLRYWSVTDAEAVALYKRLALTLPYAPQSDHNTDHDNFTTTKIAFSCIKILCEKYLTPELKADLIAKLEELRPEMETASSDVKNLFNESTGLLGI